MKAKRAIPMQGSNERLAFLIHAILDSGGNCDVVNSLLTAQPDNIYCEEDGCWSRLCEYDNPCFRLECSLHPSVRRLGS